MKSSRPIAARAPICGTARVAWGAINGIALTLASGCRDLQADCRELSAAIAAQAAKTERAPGVPMNASQRDDARVPDDAVRHPHGTRDLRGQFERIPLVDVSHLRAP